MIERSEGPSVKAVKPAGGTSPKLPPRPDAASSKASEGMAADAKALQGHVGDQAAQAAAARQQALANYGNKPAEGGKHEGQDTSNALDDTGARPIVNAVSNVANGGDFVQGINDYGTVVRGLGGKMGFLGRMFEPVAKLFDAGSSLASKVPGLMPVCSFLGKVAPVLGVAVAGLDITRAAMEKDPVKKQRYEGQAVMSSVGAVAGVVAFAGITGTAILGVAVAPIAVPIAIGVGLAAGVVSVVDEFFFEGKVASAIGAGLNKVGSWFKGLFS